MIRKSLQTYIESEMIPRYAAFDKAHREDHARMVIDRALLKKPASIRNPVYDSL
jgi:hypothetical protein